MHSTAGPVRELLSNITVLPLLTAQECAALIERADATDLWVAAPVHSDAGDAKIKDRVRRAEIIAQDEHPQLFDIVFPAISERLKSLTEKAGEVQYLVSWIHLIRYAPGGLYIAHRDAIPSAPRYMWRKFSLVCYLNDGFKSGETEFPGLGIKMRGRVGQAILFPSTYLHAGNELTEGRKYILNFYLGDPPGIGDDAPPRSLYR